jgi:predicted TIM-barrel fold metal-dependent hydrolase
MAYNGHIVIDADSHIREYWDFDRTYKENIDAEYRDKYERFSAAVKANQKRTGDVGLGAVLWPRLPGHPMGIYDAFDAPPVPPRNPAIGREISTGGHEIDPSCHWDPSPRLRDMTTAGIDTSVMFASQSDGYCMLDDVGFESALQRAYHRFMANYCSESEGRLRWVSNSNLRDVDETLSQIRHWADKDKNYVGPFVPRACPDGAMLDHPRLRPIFALAQDLDLPIWVHGGSGRPPLTPWVAAPGSIYHSWGGQYALAALIGGGVFDLFPRLRAGIFESYGGWMPYMFEKYDNSFRPGSSHTPLLERKPSEILASGQIYCSIESDEEHIAYAVEELGDHFFLFSTDYPHGGTCWPDGVPNIKGQKLSEQAKAKILGENALRFCPRLKD